MSQQRPRFFGVVPAAGRSSRMGRPKLTLPFAGRTVIEYVVSTLREGGVQPVIVITGPHAPEVQSFAGGLGAEVLALPVSTPDLRATVEHGLHYLEHRYSPHPGDAFLLAPADHPAFSASLVRRLCATYVASSDKSVVVPVHAGRRGHPVLIGCKHTRRIQAMAREFGVNQFLRECADEILESETEDRGILLNLDGPSDYAALQRYEFKS